MNDLNKSMNISDKTSWVDRAHKRYKETNYLIPPIQKHLYKEIGNAWVGGRTAIDIGCSIGIGSNILSHHARAVWGIDVNEEAIEFAKQAFRRPNVDFEVIDIENMSTRQLAKFEVVVMSEVVEHLTDPEVGLNSIKRFFNPDTIGFITAPNTANEEIAKRDAENKLHLHRWNAGEFYELMTKHFNSVVLYSADKLSNWGQEETISGDSKEALIVCKVEGVK